MFEIISSWNKLAHNPFSEVFFFFFTMKFELIWLFATEFQSIKDMILYAMLNKMTCTSVDKPLDVTHKPKRWLHASAMAYQMRKQAKSSNSSESFERECAVESAKHTHRHIHIERASSVSTTMMTKAARTRFWVLKAIRTTKIWWFVRETLN